MVGLVESASDGACEVAGVSASVEDGTGKADAFDSGCSASWSNLAAVGVLGGSSNRSVLSVAGRLRRRVEGARGGKGASGTDNQGSYQVTALDIDQHLQWSSELTRG